MMHIEFLLGILSLEQQFDVQGTKLLGGRDAQSMPRNPLLPREEF